VNKICYPKVGESILFLTPLMNKWPCMCNSYATLKLEKIDLTLKQHPTHHQTIIIVYCTLHFVTMCINWCVIYRKYCSKIQMSRSQVPCRPTWGSKYATMRKRLELGARSQLPALEGGKRGVLEVPGKTRKSGQALFTHTGLHETTQSG